MEVTTKITLLGNSFRRIENAKTEEEQFYALCDYLYLVGDDFELIRLAQKQFKNVSGIYMQAGNTLFSLLIEKGNSPQSLWSDALKTVLGSGNRDLVMFAGVGGSASVSRTVHSPLMASLKDLEVQRRIELVLDTQMTAVYLKNDPLRKYEIKSRGNGDKKRFQIIRTLNRTSKWLSIKEIMDATKTSDEPTTLKQINGINEQFNKEIGLSQDLIVRQKKDNKYIYQLNKESYFFSEKA